MGWEDMRYNTGLDTEISSDDFTEWMKLYSNQKRQNEDSKRADARLAINQANQKFLEDTRHRTKVSGDALKTWGSYGIDSGNITGAQNPLPSFNQIFDYQGDLRRAWEGYQKDMIGLSPDRETFKAKFDANYNANLSSIARRFDAFKTTIGVQKGLKGALLDRYMQKYHNADNLYMAYSSFAGSQEAGKVMNYEPVAAPESYVKKIKEIFTKPEYTDPETGETMGGGLTKLGGAGLIAMPGGAGTYLGIKSWKQFGPAKDKYLKQALADEARYKQTFKKDKAGKKIPTGTAPGSGLSGGPTGKFKETYGMLKSEAFKNGKPTDKFIKAANKIARGETIGGKALGYGKTYGGMAAGAGIGSQLGEAIGGAITGGPGGEMAGSTVGGISGAVAGAKGQRSMMKAFKQLSNPATLEKLRWWAKGKGAKGGAKKLMLKALGKLGVSAAGIVVPEPVSSAVGVAGAAWAAHDIYQIAKEIPELMDIIFTEE